MKKAAKRDTAEAIVIAGMEVLIHEISERRCWRTKYGAKNCNEQDEKGTAGYEEFACATCRAKRYLTSKKGKVKQ